MSNGCYVWAPEQKAVVFDQLSKFLELIREGKRSPEVARVLQAVISDDDVTVTPKVATTARGEVFHVTANFKSAQEAIAALDCPVKLDLANYRPEEIPLVIQPVDCRVRAVPLDRVVKTSELFGLFPRPAGPLALFAFGAKFPDEQKKAHHFTVWLDGGGRFWYVVLFVCGDQRCVEVFRTGPGNEWGERYRLLVCE
jgi:hypothetical protein